MQRARAVVHGDAVLDLRIGGEILLERGDFAAERELAGVEDPEDRGIDFFLDGKVLGFQVDERNHAIFSCGAWTFWM